MRFFSKTSKFNKEFIFALIICLTFFIAYLSLSLIKHLHFQTGYDLSVDNQIVWEYSRLMLPISTVHAYAFTPVFWDHIEFVYAFISPFYWILPDARMLIILQVIAIILSGIPVFLLARRHKVNLYVSYSLLISYFMFFGIQNALWSDVHSLVFGVSFLAFFIYFLDTNRKWLTILFFILALTSKEDIGLLTFLISFVYFIKNRKRINIYLMSASIIYVYLLFFVYYPNFTLGYQYANKGGLLSGINLFNFFNTTAKREVIFYSLSSFGFLPLLNPLFLIPFLGDLGHYFIAGNDTATSTHSIFLHYRVSDAVLLVLPTVFMIEKFNKLNNKFMAFYILFFTFLFTYILHSPLTYLTKKWFWTQPSGVKNINKILQYLPQDAYVVTQVNISPHISNRKLIVIMWGDTKDFKENSPCGLEKCAWFKWARNPKYMVVDTSPEWNIINLLANREDFIAGLNNMEKVGNIKKYKQIGSSVIYYVQKNPY